ncbi:RimK family alpha-L-glutamate ligase [Algoriphagus sp. AK58]|uniref:ATP-grasp domain-containing protein n=1 Tax=Algoriphagus sp. AK58 TaxID=1406877 RepID=UPI00164FAD66|nr:hypothetical protein [Algoriphagus sp. AK58]MBC6369206.1 hypothetical protein [Algoriphagus sp. AK58]
MKIAIHHSPREGFFSKRWIEYCESNNIPYVIVDCSSSNIVEDLKDCSGFMWHFAQGNKLDYLISISLISSLESIGIKTFPNYNSCWHFDDKLAQKYLLEILDAPFIKTWVFFNKKEAIQWINTTDFPKVFKLRGGASSSNVKLVKSYKNAKKLINVAFSSGFRQFDRTSLFLDEFNKFKRKDSNFFNLVKTFLKIFFKSDYESIKGNEKGYVYFQEFLPNNSFDIRVVVIGNRAFALKRLVRKNDFRASGSGSIIYNKDEIDLRCIKIAFEVVKKLNANCLTFDFLFDVNANPLIAEISFGFYQNAYDNCPGYWDDSLSWFQGSFNPQSWMVEDLIRSIS